MEWLAREWGAGLTRASLSSVVSDSACKDLRNFGVTGGKYRQQQPAGDNRDEPATDGPPGNLRLEQTSWHGVP